MNKPDKKLALALCAVLAAPLAASAAPIYTIRLLPQGFTGTAINEAGHVLASTGSEMVIWSEAGIKNVAGLPGAFNTGASGLNNRDDIAGESEASFDAASVAFANIGGVVHNIGAAAPDFVATDAADINDSGTVVGRGFRQSGLDTPYIYSNGTVRLLPTFGGEGGLALAISNSGYVTGAAAFPHDDSPQIEHAFLYRNGKMTDLGALRGDNSSLGFDVNERGEVAGVSEKLGLEGTRGFLYSNGKMINVGTFGGDTIATGLNDVGVVVGWSFRRSGEARGFISYRGKIVDLNRLVDRHSGWVVRSARDINDAYQIMAQLCRPNSDECRTARLDPPAGAGRYKVPPFIQDFSGEHGGGKGEQH
jgi:probable HAF family extracellular repeat protein